MVTLYYTRRYQQYLLDLFANTELEEVAISEEIGALLTSINSTFEENKQLLAGTINDADRKRVVDALGEAGCNFRSEVYQNEFSGNRVLLKTADLIAFLKLSLEYIDHTIEANRREDGLYHAYNLMTATEDSVEISYLYEMLEGQVAVLSSGYLSPEQALEVLTSLRNSSVYTARQHSYLLYPDRELTRFVDKNIIPEAQLKRSELLTMLVSSGDTSLVEQDSQGGYHFNGSFNNVDSARDVLEALKDNGYADLVDKEQALIEEIFESVFNHRQFTGRSGGMYAYEGLGSIYWHMVSKLLLAALENFRNSLEQGSDPVVVGKLADCYFDIRAGIGFNKTPDNYGAFPTDPYSHTPGFAGAKQPGMTGQVKEEVITRLMEMGLSVSGGSILFKPFILRKSEFLSSADSLSYFDIAGNQQSVELQAGQLGFTYCQIPVIYSLADETSIIITFANGTEKAIAGDTIDAQTSLAIFDKTGEVVKINVALKPGLE